LPFTVAMPATGISNQQMHGSGGDRHRWRSRNGIGSVTSMRELIKV
jgi:hypothetical protein